MQSRPVCVAASCQELCSDERSCSLNDICVGGLCQDGFCGDGLKAEVEECDLGVNNSDTGLCPDVTLIGGDGFLHIGHEECDDGNQVEGDGCSASCRDSQPEIPGGAGMKTRKRLNLTPNRTLGLAR